MLRPAFLIFGNVGGGIFCEIHSIQTMSDELAATQKHILQQAGAGSISVMCNRHLESDNELRIQITGVAGMGSQVCVCVPGMLNGTW